MKDPKNYDAVTHQCNLYNFPHAVVPLSKEDFAQPGIIGIYLLM